MPKQKSRYIPTGGVEDRECWASLVYFAGGIQALAERGVKKGGIPDFAIRVLDTIYILQQRYGVAFASQRAIATWLDKSERTVRRAIRALKKLGYIEVKRFGGTWKANTALTDLRSILTHRDLFLQGLKFCKARGIPEYLKRSMTSEDIQQAICENIEDWKAWTGWRPPKPKLSNLANLEPQKMTKKKREDRQREQWRAQQARHRKKAQENAPVRVSEDVRVDRTTVSYPVDTKTETQVLVMSGTYASPASPCQAQTVEPLPFGEGFGVLRTPHAAHCDAQPHEEAGDRLRRSEEAVKEQVLVAQPILVMNSGDPESEYYRNLRKAMEPAEWAKDNTPGRPAPKAPPAPLAPLSDWMREHEEGPAALPTERPVEVQSPGFQGMGDPPETSMPEKGKRGLRPHTHWSARDALRYFQIRRSREFPKEGPLMEGTMKLLGIFKTRLAGVRQTYGSTAPMKAVIDFAMFKWLEINERLKWNYEAPPLAVISSGTIFQSILTSYAATWLQTDPTWSDTTFKVVFPEESPSV